MCLILDILDPRLLSQGSNKWYDIHENIEGRSKAYMNRLCESGTGRGEINHNRQVGLCST